MLVTTLSDYTLLFDQWIITAPRAHVSAAVPQTQLWAKACKTALVYAVAEPLVYAAMTSASSIAMWWLLMAAYLHIPVVSGTISYMAEHLRRALEAHKNVCMRSETTHDAYQDDTGSRDSSPPQVTAIIGHNCAPAATTAPELESGMEKSPSEEVVRSPSALCTAHKPTLSYALAPLAPTVTAAATNAALLFYTRYLSTGDSEEWLDRFGFGWTTVLLVTIVCLGVSKAMNPMMGLICNRPPLPNSLSEITQRLVSLAMLFALRAQVRWMSGQTALTIPHPMSESVGIALLPDSWVGEGGGGAEESQHVFDRMLTSIPPWLSTTASLCTIVYWSGYFIWLWYQRRRQRRTASQ